MMKISKHKKKEKRAKHLHEKGQRKANEREQKLLKEAGLISENKASELVKPKFCQNAKSSQGRLYTLSIALPGSILDNAQSPELRTYLAGQIARACVVFQVDEIVVFDDASNLQTTTTEGDYSGVGKKGNSCIQLARILQYMECPQYLRKSFFPRHPDLQYAGVLNPLDCPHHMRKDEQGLFREGVVLNKVVKPGDGSYVDCGARKVIQINKELEPNLRVTVRLSKNRFTKNKGIVVSPHTPRTERGIYWGYTVRLATCLSKAIAECPYKDTGKYDLTIGTSERGESVDNTTLPPFKHVLVVFGGVQGLEAAVETDESLVGVDNPKVLFDHYFNTCPHQGSRTIRTEEAVLITMSSLRPKLVKAQLF